MTVTDDSVTTWIGRLRESDPQAAQVLWQRYVERLIRLAHAKMSGMKRRAIDEEDVVSLAFHRFLQAVEGGKFPKLEDRRDLWQLLVLVTERASIDVRRAELAEKRGGGTVRGDSAFRNPETDQTGGAGIHRVAADEPTPEFAAIATENYARLLSSLDDQELCDIAIAKMEGFSNQEIADRCGLGLRTIERKLKLIRQIWSRELN